MEDSALLRRRREAMGPAYRLFYREPLHLVRGEGVWLFDAEGRRYLDCYNNVASVGHCHPRVVAAIAEQAAKLNTHTRYLHERVVDYAERLTATLPPGLDVCMFTCTGTEANDLALRIARVVTGHQGVVVLNDAYHGNSSAVFEMSTEDYPPSEQPSHLATADAPDLYRGRFGPDSATPGENYGALIGEAADTLKQRGHGAALFICDNIFSSNGILTPPPEYLQEAYRQIRSAGGLAVADEVQSGLGRLGGRWWAFEGSAVVPDIVTMGKPLGDGHPLAAVVTTADIAARFARRYHYFNTFGGNPVAAAAGLAVLEVMEEQDIPARVTVTGQFLKRGLDALQQRFELIGDVRGRGLFFGVELVRDRGSKEPATAEAERLKEYLREHGILLSTTGPFDNVIKIRPPLVFEEEHAALLLERLEGGLQCLV